ncbi:beta-lactamase/transpeptidase-like protein [Podospora aff. communis PSN243]|uniref:Beta-lactamase/transpeptidase-like protein n=1 Tax=Podospora aff. communis PSN243 TaxID=3040156 RepID=A0AAV9G3G6_9PEZI|nr:beta-lactamase/transpeptidase-like protein [Podospora aff. communis PSN243]
MIHIPRFLAILPAAVLALECHPEGPLVPRPHDLRSSDAFQAVLQNLTSILDSSFDGKIQAGFDTQNTSISIGIVSFSQPEPDVPVWEYHRLSAENVNGTRELSRHSQYLIGSVSKAITDAIFLQSGMSGDDPVTKYLPSLDDERSFISWNNITLKALAGQVSGIVPNYGFSEYYYLKEYFETLGFPRINDSSYPECGVIGLSNGQCSKEQLLEGMLLSRPITEPETRPVYSNVAYTLLMYAVEAHTGKNYTELVRDLSESLGMVSTRPSPGDDSVAVIPPLDSTWGSDYGEHAPGGGLVSTLADLSSFMHAILSRSPALATPTRIRSWLKPHAFSGSPTSSVGAPWEIYRPPPELIFPNYNATDNTGGHTVTIISKDGAAYRYHARIALLDEYGAGISILTAGDQGALPIVLDAIYSMVIPALDDVAREEAAGQYVGTFATLAESSAGGAAANATFVLDGLSLKLVGLGRDGNDMLAALSAIWQVTAGGFLPPELGTITRGYRLYPSDVQRDAVLEDGRHVIEEDWRLEWGAELTGMETGLPGKGISNGDCRSWAVTDWIYYGQESLDRVVFVKNASTGGVIGLHVPFLRAGIMIRHDS